MIPSFRGENTNPGRYEMFYGELEDLDSAREYLSVIYYVDPKRIYVVGHSTGEREQNWLVNTVINSGQYSL